MSTVRTVTSLRQFEAIRGIEGFPVAIVFRVDWSPACHLLDPALERPAGECEGRVGFAFIDKGDIPEAARQYGVQSVPTLIVFRGGFPRLVLSDGLNESMVREHVEPLALPRPMPRLVSDQPGWQHLLSKPLAGRRRRSGGWPLPRGFDLDDDEERL